MNDTDKKETQTMSQLTVKRWVSFTPQGCLSLRVWTGNGTAGGHFEFSLKVFIRASELSSTN